MTTVKLLGIQGIRSFSHERCEVVDFEKPVTLIVGANGSGKTTIIECLKMASAGALPPNSKNGHGFIHDPQVAHLPEVKAQIRMLFKTGVMAKEKEICAIRSFQLTNKRVAGGKIKPTFKALESVLRTQKDDGTKASLSHRCADMDTEVPNLMGVSKAILENVIFCHQEDSSWPLAESVQVKKRFDDIFGSTRYTMALQNIKTLQREWTKKTKEYEHEAEMTKCHLDQANKMKSQVEEHTRTADEISARVATLDGQIAAANEEMQRAELEVVQYESKGTRITALRSVIQRIEQDRTQIVKTMELMKQEFFREPYEELLKQKQQFEERHLTETEQKVRQAQAAVRQGDSDFRAAVQNAQQLREEIGEGLAAAELLATKRKELSERLRQAGQPSVATMKAKLDAMVAELGRLQRDQRQRDAASEEKLRSVENANRNATLEAARNDAIVEDAAKGIKRLEEEQTTLARAPADLDLLMRAMRDNEAALGAQGSEIKLRELEKRLEEIGRKRNDLQYTISKKTTEVTQLEAQSSVHVEVDEMRKRLQDVEADLSNKLNTARPRLTSALDQMPEPADAETRVLAELQRTEDQLKRQRQSVQDIQNRRSGLLARQDQANIDIRRLQNEEAQIASELGVPSMSSTAAGADAASDFKGRLAKQREMVEMCRKDLAMTESAQHMYEKFREKSRNKNACQFCRRNFCDQSERNAFEESVEKLIVKIPQFLEDTHKRFDEANKEMNNLEAQRPRWERLNQYRQDEIPKRMAELKSLSDELATVQAALDPQDRELRRLEERMQQLQNLRAEAAALQEGARVVEDLRNQLRAKEVRLLGGNSKISLQAERDQLRMLQDQLCQLGREEDAVRTQREMLSKQQEQLRQALAEQKGRLHMLQAQVARRGDVDSELAQRQAELREFTEAARRARSTAHAAAQSAKELQTERDTVQESFRRDVDARDQEVRKLQREVDSLSEIEKNVELMATRVDNVDAVKAKLEEADEARRVSERDLDGLRANLEKEEDRKRKRQEVHEALKANVELKSREAEIKRNEAEIAELLQELGGRDMEALKLELDNFRKKRGDLQSQRDFSSGGLSNIRQELRKLEVEMASSLFRNVEERHRESMIKSESAALATNDLNRYHGALDRALMKYHSIKMAEINKIIRELWSKVYKGRDIDHIAIRSDADESEDGHSAPVVESGRAGRSYNYRVVMVCGEAEMDMRGRCSAGQRVLASLIIRLALAETFCVNCGILALDEPTTNLDAANIRGLAEALAGLIEARRGLAHFQLILITHDEAFVNQLCHLQVADWFYQIKKDANGNSAIDRKDIRTLMA